MSWPSTVYVATRDKGIYYTEDFCGPGEGQPTWKAVNDGLEGVVGVDQIRSFIAYEDVQVVQAGTTIYVRQNGGLWTSVLTAAEAASEVGHSVEDLILGPWWGNENGFVVGTRGPLDWSQYFCFMSTNDLGESWTSAEVYETIYQRALGGVQRIGDYCAFTYISGAASTSLLDISSDGGLTWNHRTAGKSGYPYSYPAFNRWLAAPTGYYAGVQGGVFTSRQGYKEVSGETELNADDIYGPYGPRSDQYVFDSDDANHIITNHGSYFRVTEDDFASYTSPQSDPVYGWALARWNDPACLIGGRIINSGGECPAIYVIYDDGAGGYDTEQKAGDNWTTSPFTASIPEDYGSIAMHGIWGIDVAGSVYTHAVAMPDYEGDARGTPLAGDRSAWEVDDYPEKHASDLNDEEPRYHNPWPLADGEAAVSDGDKLVATDVATQAELDAHEGKANPHGTELGDLADVDVATDPPEDGEGLVWDDVAGEWVPADVTTLADHDHSGDAGDGGTFDAANLTSGAAIDGQVLTADGAGNVEWRESAAGGRYRQFTYVPDGLGSFSFVVNEDGMPVFAQLELE